MSIATLFFADSMQPENQVLARGLRRRDPDLLDHLIQQYHYRLFRYLLYLTGNRQAAEDFFQETWLRVIERGSQYNSKWKFENWLFTIARNLVIDFRRKKRPESLADAAEPEGGTQQREFAALDGVSPIDTLAESEAGQRVMAALAFLPAAYREVLLLRFQEDLSLEEIAEVTRAPLSTVKSRLYRGLDELRVRLEAAS
jgi:RNA polymerase sigma-70 factor (ECF subfamily)